MKKSNPFSSEFICPSKCEFVVPGNLEGFFQNDPAGNRLLQEIGQKQGVWQIVGPHGCGKSTMANAIGRAAAPAFTHIGSLTIRQRPGNAHAKLYKSVCVHRNSIGNISCNHQTDGFCDRRLLILDGVENLSWLNRRLFFCSLVNSPTSVLLTTHRVLPGINVIAELDPELRHFRRIVDLLQFHKSYCLSDDDVATAFRRFDGNYRLSLRYLYDVYANALSA